MDFRLLEPGDYETYKPFFRNQPYDLCIYTLPSLIVWTNSLARHFVQIRDDILMIYIDYPKGHSLPHLIMPISQEREIMPEELYELSKSVQFNGYSNVPEAYIDHYGRDRIESLFRINEQPEFEDYVYRAKDLASLKGKKYSKKRNLIHQFEKEFVLENRVLVEQMTGVIQDECLTFLEEWCEEKDCGEEKDKVLACEREAAIKAITYIDSIELQGICLRIDGKINAFGIASVLNKKMCVLHFEKAFNNVKGLYQYFDRECARHLFTEYEYINKESDMGLPGIAHAKSSYFPVMKVKSFKLTRL
ncbi:MAG: DUF2156 domain-containing protein [Proteobacteria bacterium]|nr:DUF2156 domain-containing protein [Pseudomonadota bacterium]